MPELQQNEGRQLQQDFAKRKSRTGKTNILLSVEV